MLFSEREAKMKEILDVKKSVDETGQERHDIYVNRFSPRWKTTIAVLWTLVGAELGFSLMLAFRYPSGNRLLQKDDNTNNATSQKSPDDFSSHGLSMDYAIFQDDPQLVPALRFRITIKGEIKNGDKLALRITDPSGKTEDLATLDKRSMKENYVDFTKKADIFHVLADPEIGKYVFTLRSFTLKKDVCRRGIDLFLKNLTVKGVLPNFEVIPGTKAKFLGFVVLSLEKEGNIPIKFNEGYIEIQGGIPINNQPATSRAQRKIFFKDLKNAYMAKENHDLVLEVYYPFFAGTLSPWFGSGSKCKFKGKIFYLVGKNKRLLEFEKEVNVE